MKLLALEKRGDVWKVVLVDNTGKPVHVILAYRPGESLGDAAVRVEDLLRQLQAGVIKPAESGLKTAN